MLWDSGCALFLPDTSFGTSNIVMTDIIARKLSMCPHCGGMLDIIISREEIRNDLRMSLTECQKCETMFVMDLYE
jgi:uncharacterized protein with PIN domain